MKKLMIAATLSLAPLASGAQTDELAALRERVAALEAQAVRDAEIIANLRSRLDAAPTDPADMETLRGRILNQTLEINGLRTSLDACESGRAAEARAARTAEDRLRTLELDQRRAESDVRAARQDVERARADARRARSEAQRARSASRRCP